MYLVNIHFDIPCLDLATSYCTSHSSPLERCNSCYCWIGFYQETPTGHVTQLLLLWPFLCQVEVMPGLLLLCQFCVA